MASQRQLFPGLSAETHIDPGLVDFLCFLLPLDPAQSKETAEMGGEVPAGQPLREAYFLALREARRGPHGWNAGLPMRFMQEPSSSTVRFGIDPIRWKVTAAVAACSEELSA